MKSSLFSHRIRYALLLAELAVGGMLLGLFLSRALLSVSIGLFFLAAPLRLGIGPWLQQAVRDRLVHVGVILWMIPFLSGGWSTDLSAWADVLRIKLPLLLLPLGWVGWQPDKKRLDVLGGMLTILVFLGSVYSLLPWLQDAASVRSDYLRGATLRTVLDNDRVRFSWLVVALCWWLQGQWNGSTSRARWVIALLIFFFGFYLHVLAVRIGLLCFYLLAGFLLLRSAANPAHRRWAWLSLLLIFLLPVVFYQTVSTFRSRVDYIRYDWSHTFKGSYLPGGNDAIRVRSWQVARDLIRLHPVVGVGFGDIRSEMDATYQRLAPGVPTSDRIYPANEWAVYGVGAGWIGIIVFSIALILLFFGSAAYPFRWRSWVLATILPMVTDIGLEVQYGVFLVPFLLAWFRSVDGSKNPEIRVA